MVRAGSPSTICGRGLCLSVDGRALVRGVDIEVSKGEVVALVGRNGSGKSTLLKMLARQLAPSVGAVSFEGAPVERWDRRTFARSVAYLPQETPPAAGTTVQELVCHGRYPWHGALGRFSAEDEAKVAEAMRLTGVEAFADRMVDTLSGGERQRAWIAMLVAQDSQCLLLDEPISALDIQHQIEVLSLVRALARDKSLAVLLVLHDINMAARFCDRICALRDGRKIADEAPDRVMNAETLHEIYGVKMTILPHPAGAAPLAHAL